MHVADIKIRPIVDARGQYDGAVLCVIVGALPVFVRLSADAARALCVSVLGGGSAEVSGEVGCLLALPPALRKRGAELTPETLNAREVKV